MGQILRDSFGQEDVTAFSAIHDAACKIDSRPCNVHPVIYVTHFIDRPAVNAHPKLQLRMFFQLFANLDRAPRRRFGAIEKNERHAIPHWEPNQLSGFFRNTDLLGTADYVSQLFLILALLI
jgi:hypothetical protein